MSYDILTSPGVGTALLCDIRLLPPGTVSMSHDIWGSLDVGALV